MKDIMEFISRMDYQQKLMINENEINRNYFPLQETKEEIESITFDDLINDSLGERVRRFNSSTTYLIDALDNIMSIYLLIQANPTIDLECYIRKEIRNACINFEIYIDKIILLCKYYFCMDLKKTDKRKLFIETLEQFQTLDTSVGVFIKECSLLHKDDNLKYINSIRDKEVHMESPFDTRKCDFHPEPQGVSVKYLGYKTETKEILEKLKNALLLGINLKEKLHVILKRINPIKMANFIKTHTLKNVYIPKERWKHNS